MKKKGKRFFSVFLSILMVAGTLPAMTLTAVAEESGIAGSGTEKAPYQVSTGAQLREAVDQIPEGTEAYIRLTGDSKNLVLDPLSSSEKNMLPPTLGILNKRVVLDLNGKTLDVRTAGEGCSAVALNNAQLTVKDGSAGEEGKIMASGSYIVSCEYDKTDDSSVRENTFVLQGGTLENTLKDGGGILVSDSSASVRIEGGSVKTLGAWGTLLSSNCSTVITGGSFYGSPVNEQSRSGMIYLTGTASISGGFFDCRVEMDYPNGAITGGYFSDDALSDSLKERALNNTEYGLKIVRSETDPGVDAGIYKWKVVRLENTAEPDTPDPGDLYIGGVKVTGTAEDIFGDAENGRPASASYDEESCTLTLRNFSYGGPGHVYCETKRFNGTEYTVSAGIYYRGYEDDNGRNLLTIRLEGENRIEMLMPDQEALVNIPGRAEDARNDFLDTSAAVYVEGADLRIEGDRLTAKGAAENSVGLAESCGIFVESVYDGLRVSGGSLTVDGSTIRAEGQTAMNRNGLYESGDSEGIYAEGKILFRNADISAAGGEGADESEGIYGDNTITVENSQVQGTGGTGESLSSGIYTSCDAVICGSSVTAEADNSEEDSFGFYLGSRLNVENSDVNASSGNAKRYSDGIFSGYRTELKNSSVTAVSGQAEASEAGIYVDSSLMVSGSTVSAKSADSPAGKNHGIHTDYSLEVHDGSTVTGTAGASPENESNGINVDGDLVIDGNSTLNASGGDSESGYSRGAAVESVLSIEKGSTLNASGGNARISTGLLCGQIMDSYTPLNYWESPEAYIDSIRKNENAQPDILTGNVNASASESAEKSIGMLLSPYEGETKKFLTGEELTRLQKEYRKIIETEYDSDETAFTFSSFLSERYESVEYEDGFYSYRSMNNLQNDSLKVTGSLLAQGNHGALRCVRISGSPDSGDSPGTLADAETGSAAVILTAGRISAGEKYDGTDRTEQTSPFNTDSAYRYIQTSASSADPETPGYRSCARDGSCPVSGFKDSDPREWYHDGVHYVLEKGIMNGTGETSFSPKDSTTRAMIVTMLWRMEGSPSAAQSSFKDLEAGSWYEQAVNWASACGIVNGYSNTEFGPDDRITREQLAAVLYRYAQSRGKGFSGDWSFPLDYPDASEASDFALEALCWMTANQIIQGDDNGMLRPGADASRAEVAVMLMRLCENALQ